MPDAAQSYRILGIDPGLGATGYAILALEDERAEPRLLEGGTLRPAKQAPLEERLAELYGDLTEIIRQFRPDIMAVENLYSHVKHPRTSIIMGHARGVIFLAASQAGVPVQSYGATEIKKSLAGAGHASKGQIQRLVQQRLRLPDLPEPADLADAIAAAYCHYDRAVRRAGISAAGLLS